MAAEILSGVLGLSMWPARRANAASTSVRTPLCKRPVARTAPAYTKVDGGSDCDHGADVELERRTLMYSSDEYMNLSM